MLFLRLILTTLLICFLAFFDALTFAAATPPLGILTQAVQAHVDEAQAFPGLSIFDGEQLCTGLQGHITVRVDHSTLALAGSTTATVVHVTDGIHVDLASGSVYFNGVAGEAAEIHVEEALLRTVSKQATQVSVSLLAPKVLQVTAQKGGLNFNYREEFRFLPEGQTYRIYLDAPAEPQVDAVSPALKSGIPGKVAYFIMGAGPGAGAAWGIHAALASGNLPISPSKP